MCAYGLDGLSRKMCIGGAGVLFAREWCTPMDSWCFWNAEEKGEVGLGGGLSDGGRSVVR